MVGICVTLLGLMFQDGPRFSPYILFVAGSILVPGLLMIGGGVALRSGRDRIVLAVGALLALSVLVWFLVWFLIGSEAFRLAPVFGWVAVGGATGRVVILVLVAIAASRDWVRRPRRRRT